MNRTEVLEEHEATWATNGLRNARYRTVSTQQLNDYAVRITVDLLLNGHWTDLVSGVDDTQLEEPVDSLRARFNASSSRTSSTCDSAYSTTSTNDLASTIATPTSTTSSSYDDGIAGAGNSTSNSGSATACASTSAYATNMIPRSGAGAENK